jgi:ribonuclease Z
MYVTMLGTGAAFADPDRAQSGILVTLDNGTRYMFDCGAGTVRNMVAANASPVDVKAVFLTHLHHDHICDFPLFAITGWMWDRDCAPIVLGPKGTKHFCDSLFEGGAFDSDFRARSAYPLRQGNLEAVRPDVREVSPGLVYEDEDVKIWCDYVEHIPREISECFGIRFEAEGKSLAFSAIPRPATPWSNWRGTWTCCSMNARSPKPSSNSAGNRGSAHSPTRRRRNSAGSPPKRGSNRWSRRISAISNPPTR